MARTAALVEALKRELRARRLTYADVARHMAVSEASVKRIFARGDLTLARVDKVCELLGLEFSDLARALAGPGAALSRLTEEQERELVADPKLMLVALCALSHMPFERILETYEISEPECVRMLARLDRLRFVELLPGNRYRLLAGRAFAWIPDGPIQQLFKREVGADFFRADFGGEHELLVLMNGTPSKSSAAALIARLKRLAADFADLRAEDARLPWSERRALTLLLAARPWEPEFLARFRRRRAGPGARAAPPRAQSPAARSQPGTRPRSAA